MKIGIITKPNAKGQIVIPKEFRDALGIDSKVLLQLSLRGSGIYIQPIEGVITKEGKESSFVEILRKTQGAWVGDDWEKTRARRRKIELAAARRRKKEW